MKNNYVKPELGIVTILAQDIILTSFGFDTKEGDHLGIYIPGWDEGEGGF